MVIKQGNLNVYDNFKVGIAEAPQEPGTPRYCHISFSEQDYPEEFALMNPSHIFKIHEQQMDTYIEMLQKWQGKKHIHVPRIGEMP